MELAFQNNDGNTITTRSKKKTVKKYTCQESKQDVKFSVFKDCSLLYEYLTDCKENKMSMWEQRKKFTTAFLKYLHFSLKYNLDEQSISRINLEAVKLYEEYFILRVQNSEIKSNSAHVYLQHMRHFLVYLRNRGVINFKYKITDKIPQKPIKKNDYYSIEDLNLIIQTALCNKSTFALRNLCILMLFIETGCRPIELSNLTLRDIKLTERQITLTCAKSGARTLSIEKDLIEPLQLYIQERLLINTESNHFFITKDSNKLTPEYIRRIINQFSKKTFGSNYISARGLRHTNVTNLIETNDIERVAEIMGHKHWHSTMLYISFSREKLIANTIKYNPLKGVLYNDNKETN